MNLSELRLYKNEIETIAAQYGVKNIRVFGSVARGEEREQSDVDFIVEMEKGRTLFDRIGFKQELQRLLHVKVDVISEKAIKPRFQETISMEAVFI
jgi:predicted nucleotidyltransferase